MTDYYIFIIRILNYTLILNTIDNYMDYYDIINDIINCYQLISVVLQKLENGNVKVKHLPPK